MDYPLLNARDLSFTTFISAIIVVSYNHWFTWPLLHYYVTSSESQFLHTVIWPVSASLPALHSVIALWSALLQWVQTLSSEYRLQTAGEQNSLTKMCGKSNSQKYSMQFKQCMRKAHKHDAN